MTGLLHDFVNILRLEVVLKERIMEELPVDLGDLNLAPSLLRLLLDFRSVMGYRSNLSGFR